MCELIFIEQYHCQRPRSMLSSRLRSLSSCHYERSFSQHHVTQLMEMAVSRTAEVQPGDVCSGSTYHEEIFMHLDAQSSRYMGFLYSKTRGFMCRRQIYTLNNPFTDIQPITTLRDTIIKALPIDGLTKSPLIDFGRSYSNAWHTSRSSIPMQLKLRN